MCPAAPTNSDIDRFRFGVGMEFLLVDADTLAPLWHQDLRFDQLNGLLESIPFDDMPSCSKMPLRPPHRKAMPFLVSGHASHDAETGNVDVMTKGVEIRTPASSSPRHTLSILRELRSRLADALWGIGLRPVSLSYHPNAPSPASEMGADRQPDVEGAMEALSYYGLQVRIGLPPGLQARLDIDDLHGKVRHYAPGLAAFSLAAPFCDSGVWDTGEGTGKSRHIARRARFSPSLTYEADDAANLVFGGLDASCRDADIHAYLLLWLALVLDDTLASRGTIESYRRDMGRMARLGFDDPATRARASVLLESAPQVLERWGIQTTPLAPMRERLERRRTLADDFVDWYRAAGTMKPVIEKLAVRARVRV